MFMLLLDLALANGDRTVFVELRPARSALSANLLSYS
jgi:hypothetical protein